MKHLLLTTIAAVVLVGCATPAQQSSPPAEAKPVELVAEAVKPESPTAKSANPQANRALLEAAKDGNIAAVKQAITDGANVNTKDADAWTPLFFATGLRHKELVALLIAKGADVNAKDKFGETPIGWADAETDELLRKHGGKTAKELKAEGK